MAPIDDLKKIQLEISRYIYKKLDEIIVDKEAWACVHGFRRKRSPKTNAECHIGKRLLVNVDLKDFFPSIPRDWLLDFYTALDHPQYDAEDLLMLSTVDGKLVQGSPCSPMIANLYPTLSGLDRSLMSIFDRTFTYTRYADDLSFSTNSDVSRAQLEAGVIPEIYRIVRLNKLVPNLKKTSIRFYYNRLNVTGVTVNVAPTIKRNDYKRIRSILYKMRGQDLDSTTLGYLSYVKSISVEKYNKLMKYYGGINNADQQSNAPQIQV